MHLVKGSNVISIGHAGHPSQDAAQWLEDILLVAFLLSLQGMVVQKENNDITVLPIPQRKGIHIHTLDGRQETALEELLAERVQSPQRIALKGFSRDVLGSFQHDVNGNSIRVFLTYQEARDLRNRPTPLQLLFRKINAA